MNRAHTYNRGPVEGRLDGLTLREIGERLGFSRERARQLETDGLRKLATLLGAESQPKTIADGERVS